MNEMTRTTARRSNCADRRNRPQPSRNSDVIGLIGGSITDGLERLIDAIDQSTESLADRLERNARPSRGSSRRVGERSGCTCSRCTPHVDDRCCDDHRSCGCAMRDCDDCCGSTRTVSCECRCCVSDADLIVQARLGEVRVVPVVFTNRRRREREITVNLGEFTTRGGKPAPITATIIGSANFTLKPCEEHTMAVGITVREAQAAPTVGDAVEHGNDGEIPDVDDCLVAYGHLTIEGCDIRPVRIAVAILPRTCGAHRVECGCGCC